MREEHYDAQIKFAKLLYEMLEIPNIRFIRKYRAYKAAMDFRETHKKCCEWANEEI